MEFRLLGPVEVLEGGRALPVGGRRQRAVLVHLLLSPGTPVSTARLIEQVWGDAPPAAVRTSLHTYVSRLRAVLGAARVETRSTGYVLHATEDEIDAVRFERTIARARAAAADDPAHAAELYDLALSLWRGPALGDLADEESLRPTVALLDHLQDAVVAERMDVGLALEQASSLLPQLEDVLARHPLREDLWGRYVLALYRSDRQAEALAAYDRVRHLLRDELGLQPGEELRRLQAQVLDHDPGLTSGGAALHGYRLGRVLSDGACAVVHVGLQPRLEREVAVKVLRSRPAADRAVRARLEAAVRAAVRVEHPSVVPLLDWWCERTAVFVVMPLLRGGTLADRLATRRTLDGTATTRLGEQLAPALEACRRHGLRLRPLTPRDVLLDDAGNAFLPVLSFGSCVAPDRPVPAPPDDGLRAFLDRALDVQDPSRFVQGRVESAGAPSC
jgi:DNA-binding SARP family transcriptional activator